MVAHPPTLFEVFARLVPIGLQALAACTLILLLLALWVRRDLARSDGVIPDERFTVRNFCELLLEGIELGVNVRSKDLEIVGMGILHRFHLLSLSSDMLLLFEIATAIHARVLPDDLSA